MQLNQFGKNQTEVKHNGIKVFFSYKTPVAVEIDQPRQVYVTTEKFSATTTRHINNWLGGNQNVERVSQEEIERLTKF